MKMPSRYTMQCNRLACLFTFTASLAILAMVQSPLDAQESHTKKTSNQERVYQAMKKKISVDWKDVPITKAIEEVAKHCGVVTRVDLPALEDYGIDAGLSNWKITFKANDMTSRSVLSVLLIERDISWHIRDEVVWISTFTEMESSLITRNYDVDDLVVWRKDGEPVYANFDDFIEAIISTIDSDSWDHNGGPASIQEVRSNGIFSISVSHTAKAHYEVENYLESIRELREERDIDKLVPESKQPRKYLPSQPYISVSSAITAECNAFSCDLFRQVASQNTAHNLAIAPYGIYESLGVLSLGAGESYATTIREVAHLPNFEGKPHPGLLSLQHKFKQYSQSRYGTFQLASQLWADVDLSVRGRFMYRLHPHSSAVIRRLDLTKPVECANLLNTWAAKQTQDHLTTIATPASIPSKKNALFLTSAMYFNCGEIARFDIGRTFDKPFHSFTGEQTAPMMSTTLKCGYAEKDGTQVVGMGLSNWKYQLWVFLPKEGKEPFAKYVSTFSAQELDAWKDRMKRHEVQLRLPRLKIDAKNDIQSALSTMGLGQMFDPKQADLSGLSNTPGVHISSATQTVRFIMDEEGTPPPIGGGTFGGSFPPPPPKATFNANRPFVFLVKDRSSGTLLLLGTYLGPDAKQR